MAVSARSVRDEDGTFRGAALAYSDVTDFMRALRVKDEFVARNSERLGRLVADLLQSAQLHLGPMAVVRTYGDLAAIVRS